MDTTKEIAQALTGLEYRSNFMPREITERAKAAGIVIVYGESDDLMEFRGAVDEEVGAWEGTTEYMTSHGLVQNKCGCQECPSCKRLRKGATPIKAIWGEVDATWTFKTDIPHETFDIIEDGDVFCRGIVFRLEDVSA